MRLFLPTKKTLGILALVILFVAVQFLVPVSEARAAVPLFVPTIALTNPPGVGLLSMDTLKKYVLDLAARIVAGTLLHAITSQIVGWIQGNNGKNVGFVANLDAAFRQETDLAGGEFLNNLSGINLCTANMRAFLQISLRTPGIGRKLGCTLSGIGANADRFFQNFRN
ncbi:MAG: hypothetical protein HY221_00940, partial [Candidatus Sungbacteria bacterium]|nr:hypothetical protein [Candidatus Sungbacteria bacterium]